MPIELGERFALSLAAKDADALKELLAPSVSFHALTPGATWQCQDAATAVDEVILGTWFSPERSITRILAIDCDHVGPIEHVGYRFGTALPDGDYVVEQHAYLTSDGGTITSLRVLCSGFVHEQ